MDKYVFSRLCKRGKKQEECLSAIWRVKKSRKAIIDNPSNSILNGTYESYIILYQDRYEAEFIDCIWFKNEEFFGIESSLRGRIDSTFLLWAPRNDISIYDYIEKKGYDEFKRDLVVFELLDREELNKVISIRDYVGISQENYDSVPFVGVKGIDHRAMLGEIPPSLLVNLITWMRNKGISDEEIVDCMLFICKDNE